MRLAVCIAQAGPDAKVSLREVAEHEELSLKYLEQIARPMVSAGLLASVRGKGGGYRLARDRKISWQATCCARSRAPRCR